MGIHFWFKFGNIDTRFKNKTITQYLIFPKYKTSVIMYNESSSIHHIHTANSYIILCKCCKCLNIHIISIERKRYLNATQPPSRSRCEIKMLQSLSLSPPPSRGKNIKELMREKYAKDSLSFSPSRQKINKLFL